MPPTPGISSSTTMSDEVRELTEENLRKCMEEFFTKSKGVYIDGDTRRRLEELCSQLARIYGLVESVLQLALTKQGTERTNHLKAALGISSRGTTAIKLLLSEWHLAEESNAVLRTLDGLTQGVLQAQDGAFAKLPTLDDICDAYIQQVLNACGGNRQRTAQILGIGRTSLYRYQRLDQEFESRQLDAGS